MEVILSRLLAWNDNAPKEKSYLGCLEAYYRPFEDAANAHISLTVGQAFVCFFIHGLTNRSLYEGVRTARPQTLNSAKAEAALVYELVYTREPQKHNTRGREIQMTIVITGAPGVADLTRNDVDSEITMGLQRGLLIYYFLIA